MSYPLAPPQRRAIDRAIHALEQEASNQWVAAEYAARRVAAHNQDYELSGSLRAAALRNDKKREQERHERYAAELRAAGDELSQQFPRS